MQEYSILAINLFIKTKFGYSEIVHQCIKSIKLLIQIKRMSIIILYYNVLINKILIYSVIKYIP